jgi:radical SAM protein with 4Fe4S-binding SPASM domain
MHCNHDIGKDDELVFDGCGAGITTFNVEVSGNMTPCALLPPDISIMNITDLTIDEMVQRYQENDFVKRMLLMDIGGKCGSCKLKYQCGGCRARALVVNGDMFAEDPHCFL